jgi:hypothetical protein
MVTTAPPMRVDAFRSSPLGIIGKHGVKIGLMWGRSHPTHRETAVTMRPQRFATGSLAETFAERYEVSEAVSIL